MKNAQSDRSTKGEKRTHSRISGYRVKHRPGRAKPWIFIRTDESGARLERGFASEEDARRALKKAETERIKYGEATTTFSPEDFAELNEARRILGDLDITLPQVAAFYMSHGKKDCPEITVAEAVELFLSEKKTQGLSERHTRDLKSRLGLFANDHGDEIVSRIDSGTVLRWLKERGGEPRTMKNNLVAVLNWANFAARRGWTDKAPEIHETDLPKIRSSSKEVFRIDEARKFFAWLEVHRPDWCAFYALAAFAGIRAAECERLRGEWIDAARRRIVIPKEICKTGDDWIMVGLPENLWAWLEKYPVVAAIKFPSSRPAALMRKKLINEGVIARWPDNGHRHSFATYHMSANESADKTALLTRHRSAATLWRSYLRALAPKKEAEEYFKIYPAGIDRVAKL